MMGACRLQEAVFKAKKGDIVGPVKSEFGYHIIKVTDVKAESVRPPLGGTRR